MIALKARLSRSGQMIDNPSGARFGRRCHGLSSSGLTPGAAPIWPMDRRAHGR
jgi:hypothetical protein